MGTKKPSVGRPADVARKTNIDRATAMAKDLFTEPRGVKFSFNARFFSPEVAISKNPKMTNGLKSLIANLLKFIPGNISVKTNQGVEGKPIAMPITQIEVRP
jgi:hypothetical protein